MSTNSVNEPQRPLVGQYKIIVNLTSAGRVDLHVLHHPYPASSYGTRLLGHADCYLEDHEILDYTWQQLVERALQLAVERL